MVLLRGRALLAFTSRVAAGKSEKEVGQTYVLFLSHARAGSPDGSTGSPDALWAAEDTGGGAWPRRGGVSDSVLGSSWNAGDSQEASWAALRVGPSVRRDGGTRVVFWAMFPRHV